MKKKLLVISILLLSLIWFDKAYALTAEEVYNYSSDCTLIELAEAKEDGNLVKVQCYNSYGEAKDAMNNTNNDNLVILENHRIIDAKYALIDYDQKTSTGYVNIYSDVNLVNKFTYVSGMYSDDAVLLDFDYNTGRVKIKVAGAVGWIARYENEASKSFVQYDVVPLAWVKSPSYYEVKDDTIYHHLPLNVYNTRGDSSFSIDRKPTMLNDGNYYSYDGNYFYTNFKLMINDYKNGNYNNAINKDNPYYNYYQYLSFRTKTVYNAANLNKYIDAITVENSKLRNMGQNFIDTQNKYNTNAAMMLAVAINESGKGSSPISQNYNNLFGLGAIDANPSGNALQFGSVGDCIDDFGFAWLSGKFLQPGDYRFFGANLGNKGSGLNVKYASDAYWGEKAAHWYYSLDKYYGFQDFNNYKVAVLNSNYSNTVYAKKQPNGLNVSTKNYQYKYAGSPIIVLGEENINGEVWYKIYSDPTLDSNLEYYEDLTYYNTTPRINYNYDGIVYVPSKYFKIIFYSVDKKIDPQPSNPTPTPSPSPTPAPTPTKTISSIVSDAGYLLNNGIISKVIPSTTVEGMREKIVNAGGNVVITNQNGTEIKTGTIGTGYKVSINNEINSVVIYGDINGDGVISAVDYVNVKNHIMGTSPLTGVSLEAANVNKDETISAVDYVNIKNYIMGVSNVIQN